MIDTLGGIWLSSGTAQGTAERVLQWGHEAGILWIGGIVSIPLLLHVLASWAEKKGWIYYRRKGTGGTGTALSNAMAEFDAVLNPASEHRIDEERTQRIIASQAGLGQMSTDETSDWLANTDPEDPDEVGPTGST